MKHPDHIHEYVYINGTGICVNCVLVPVDLIKKAKTKKKEKENA